MSDHAVASLDPAAFVYNMRAVTAPWTMLRYRDGYGPERTTRTELVELTLSADRHARLVCPGSPPIVFEGWLAEWVFPELYSHLHDTGFPALPQVPAGRSKAILSVASEAGTLQAWIEPAHRQHASVMHGLLLLEAVASALCGGTLPAYKSLVRPVLAAPPVVR